MDRYCSNCGKDVECYITVETETFPLAAMVKVLVEAHCPNCALVLAAGGATVNLNGGKTCE